MNICRIIGCFNAVDGKTSRCEEHALNCVAEGCDVETEAVRCSKHAARYWRLGHSALRCKNAGCTQPPADDYASCAEHVRYVSDVQESINAAFDLLSRYGKIVKYTIYDRTKIS